MSLGQLGWVRVGNGWQAGYRNGSGKTTLIAGAPILAQPGSLAGLGDLVPMPLPTEWGPTVIPPGASAGPGADDYDYTAPYPGPGGGGAGGGGGTPGALVSVPNPTTGPAFPWGRQPIIPDGLLPPTLQRGNPLLRRWVWGSGNVWDRRLRHKAQMWAYVRAHGGLKSCCRIPELGAPIWDYPPWMVMPSQGEKIEEMFSQPLTAFQSGGVFTGLDVVVGQFTVDNGYDGVINRFVCQFTGDGFADFSGNIVWRLKVANRYARNLGNVTNSYGSFQTAFSVPLQDNIRLVSQQTVYLIANVPVDSPISSGVIAAGVFGWQYPRR